MGWIPLKFGVDYRIKINLLNFHAITDIYETVNATLSDSTGMGNVAVDDNRSMTEANKLEICRKYSVEKGTILMEPNTAYNDIEMQICDAYGVEKNVTMESNIAA
jgi:hypothetical protein